MFGRWVSFWGVPIFRGETLKIKTSGVYLLVYHITTWAQLLPFFFLKLVVNPRHSPPNSVPRVSDSFDESAKFGRNSTSPGPKNHQKIISSHLLVKWKLNIFSTTKLYRSTSFFKKQICFFPSKRIWISFNLLDHSPKFVTTNSLFDWVNSLTILFGCSGLFGGSGRTSICGTSWVVGSNGWSWDDPAKVNIGSMGPKRCWKMLEGIFFCMAHFVSSVFDCG